MARAVLHAGGALHAGDAGESRARRVRVNRGHAHVSRNRAAGFLRVARVGARGARCLATPAMNVADGATFATQFGGASLTERSTGDFAGDFGAVVGATQAELPPWLRGSSGSGAGADADGADAFPKRARVRRYEYAAARRRRRRRARGGRRRRRGFFQSLGGGAAAALRTRARVGAAPRGETRATVSRRGTPRRPSGDPRGAPGPARRFGAPGRGDRVGAGLTALLDAALERGRGGTRGRAFGRREE